MDVRILSQIILIFSFFIVHIGSTFVFNTPTCLKIKCHGSKIVMFQYNSCPSSFTGSDSVRFLNFDRCGTSSTSGSTPCNGNDLPTNRGNNRRNQLPPSCPQGSSWDGTSCKDIDECQLVHPCHTPEACQNLSPGFRCDPCPSGYTGNSVQGIGVEFARKNSQVINLKPNLTYSDNSFSIKICPDVNECEDGKNGGCVTNSRCINTPGSRICGECLDGFIGNQSIGCFHRTKSQSCPDGTMCDMNAVCYQPKGQKGYKCRVSNFIPPMNT